ncbi:hypothetical protein Acr_00g0020750 [Actinidia rufa]|uniref:Uncharacterized protein n=1 Tax=Actinidia rufa TaxID=165716 RepID=A0A7J0DDW6_9ERIC|nr:hypothetical protein Acr_00g0020750 [Actinidia rufa]
MITSSGRGNAKGKSTDGVATLGDEGESRRSRDELRPVSQLEVKFELKLGSYVKIMAHLRAQIRWYNLYSFPSVSPLLCSDIGIHFVRMSKRISLKKISQKVEEAKGMNVVTKSTPATKRVVIRKKRLREEASNVSAIVLGFSLAIRVGTSGMMLHSKFLEHNQPRWRCRIEEERSPHQEEGCGGIQVFRSLPREAVESVASKYFSEGFNFYEGQLAHYHPNLGIDLDGMGLVSRPEIQPMRIAGA